MSTIDFDNLNRAVDLLRANQDVLKQITEQLINTDGFAHHEVIIICGAYTFFWKELIDGFDPGAEKNAVAITARGQSVVSLSAGTKVDVVEYLVEMGSDILVPSTPPAQGKIWTLFLHECGHTWLQV